MIAILALGTGDPLQRVNALKNFLAGCVNGIAAILFLLVADVDWAVAGLIAVGSIAGGFLGAGVGRHIPAPALRGIIVVIGTVAIIGLLT
jgi:uncharacterized membrane protein YfcA